MATPTYAGLAQERLHIRAPLHQFLRQGELRQIEVGKASQELGPVRLLQWAESVPGSTVFGWVRLLWATSFQQVSRC